MEEEEEEESLFRANAVNEEDPERDRTGSRERTWGFLVYTLHLDSDSDAGYAVLPRDSR